MRTIVITGATSGFGKGFVREFLANGDRVIATGRKLSQRRDVLENERAFAGDRLFEMDLDVTVPEQRRALADFIRHDAGGRIDVLINNAGYGLFGAFENCDEKQLRAQFEVNVFGLMLLTRELLPFLRAARGTLFNVSSALGFMGLPLTSLYCSTKFAVEGFSESLAHELAPHGVKVCLIEPGSYQTGFGDGSQWGPNPTGSAYAAQEESYRRRRETLARKKPINPDFMEVPRRVVELSRRPSVPLRVRFGKDSNAGFLAKWLLPSSLFMRIIGKSFR